MYEIELKAHLLDRAALLKLLPSFAQFAGSVRRDDTYYNFFTPENKKIAARIRIETPVAAPGINLPNPVKPAVLLTYKRKELKTDASGASIEVNDEKECELSDRETLETLLLDTGFKFSHSKTKTVIDFKYQDATIEVVNIEKLGDFIEIEILSPSNDDSTVKKYQDELKAILAKCQIEQEQIEERYYSDMLKNL